MRSKHGTPDWRDRPGLRSPDHRGQDQIPRLDRQQLGAVILTSQGFTPVCTTELGALAKLKPEFDKRGVKLMGLSVDAVDRHSKWSEDIKETQGAAPNYPMIGDTDYNVSKLYEMLPASTSGDPLARTPADNQTVRNVFVIGPDKKIKLVMVYPMTTGRNFQEI